MKRLPFPPSPTTLKAHIQQLRRLPYCVSSAPSSRLSNTCRALLAPSASLSARPLSKIPPPPPCALHITTAAKFTHPPCLSPSSPTWLPICSSIAALSLAIITVNLPHSSANTSPLSFPMLTHCIVNASKQS